MRDDREPLRAFVTSWLIRFARCALRRMIRIGALEELQPGEGELIAGRAGFLQFGGSLAPVEADPAGGSVVARAGDEVGEIVGAAGEGEELFDHDRFVE